MICWITDDVATAAWDAVGDGQSDYRLDVRDLVDKAGNRDDAVRSKIDEALAALGAGRRVVVCCDYGMSRSNAIAAGIIARQRDISLAQAIEILRQATNASAIRLEVLSVVERVLDERHITAPSGGRSRVLVTGAGGFIGRRVVPLLRSTGLEVVAPTHTEMDLQNDIVPLHLKLRDYQPSILLHLANPRAYSTNAGLGQSLTLLKNVLDAAVESRVHLIYLSGWEIYSGYRGGAMVADESTPALPGSTYGRAKWLCEQLLRHYRDAMGLRATIVRSSPAYGVDGQRPKFIWNFLEKAVRGEAIAVHRYENGPPHLDLVHVDDLAVAISLATAQHLAEDVNIGTGVATSTTTVAERLVFIGSSSSQIREVLIEGNAPNIVMDASRAEVVLGWRAKIDLETGLRQLVEASLAQNTPHGLKGADNR